MKRILKIIAIILGVLLVVLLIGPFLVPIPPLEGVSSPEKLADSDSQFIDVKGLRVHYKKFGQGTPNFILLHGFAASEFSWREIYKPLAQYGTVMAYDRPAFGLTSRPLPGSWTGENPYSNDTQVELVIALMDAMKMDKAILVGNSAGGGIAAMAALKYPQRVQALVLVDAAVSSNASNNNNFNVMNVLSNTPQLQRIGPLLVRNIRDWGIEFGKSAWHDPTKITPEIWAGYTEPLQTLDWDVGLWQFQSAPRTASYANRLKEITMPALVIAGDDDRVIPTQKSIDLAQVLPNAKLVVIPNSGHVPHEETPNEFMQAMKDWLATLSK
jgi:pimeloyl-ACP methyl ester carboxylesterase